MAEAVAVENTEKPAPVATEKLQEQTENKTERPEGWDLVELPPAVQKRFNRVFAEMKQSHRDKLEMADMARKAVERADAVERKLAEKETEDRADTLKAMKVQALDKGDHVKATEIDDQLTKLRTPKPVAEKPREQPRQAQQPGLTNDQVEVIREWAEEVGDSGNFSRPWAQAGHPKHDDFIRHAQELIDDPRTRARGIGAVLDSIDRRMGSSKKVASVLSGDGGRAPNKTSLSDDERRVAKLMYPKDPKALERYAAAKEKLSKGRA